MNLPRILLLVGSCVAFALALRLEAFAASDPPARWVAQLHGVARIDDGAVSLVIPSAEPIVGIAVDTRHGQLWIARGNALEVHSTANGESLASLDLPDARQIHALGYDRARDEVWVAADGTLRRFGPNGAQTSSVPLGRIKRPLAVAAGVAP